MTRSNDTMLGLQPRKCRYYDLVALGANLEQVQKSLCILHCRISVLRVRTCTEHVPPPQLEHSCPSSTGATMRYPRAPTAPQTACVANERLHLYITVITGD